MPREFGRNVRIADAIQRIAAPLLTTTARDLGVGMVTITGVEVASDLTVAKLLVSILGNRSETDVLPTLRALLPSLRTAVARELRLKKVPMLRLEEDRTVARSARIAELLKSPKAD
jgi:ribosome-binding factor A